MIKSITKTENVTRVIIENVQCDQCGGVKVTDKVPNDWFEFELHTNDGYERDSKHQHICSPACLFDFIKECNKADRGMISHEISSLNLNNQHMERIAIYLESVGL